MIWEALQHLLTPCPKHLRRMGYLKEAIGLKARYRRNRVAWTPHLEASRSLIGQAAHMCEPGGRAVVIGSGLLLDVPVEDLSKHFDEVVLVDILHMPATRKVAQKFPNVRLDTRDVTGMVGPLYDQVMTGRADAVTAVADVPLEDADLVVSANILSQLPIRPSLFVGESEAMEALARTMMAQHLAALAAHPGTVCLITETWHQWSDGESLDPLKGVVIPESLRLNARQWTWDFAPHPERHPELDLSFTVEGSIRPGSAGT